MGKTKDLKTTW